jgi:hypothetical protein
MSEATSAADDSQGKDRVRSMWHAQRLTELFLAIGLIGVVSTLIWIAWPRLRETFAPDEFAIFREFARESENSANSATPPNVGAFDCAMLDDGLATLVERGEALWNDGVFRVVRLELESAHLGESARVFAFKHVQSAPSHHIASANKRPRPALPEHLRRPAHFLNESEHGELMEKYDAHAANRRARPPVKNHDEAESGAAHAAADGVNGARKHTFGRRIMRHRGGGGILGDEESAQRRIAAESPEHHARAHGDGDEAASADEPVPQRRPRHRRPQNAAAADVVDEDADADEQQQPRRMRRGTGRQLLALTFEQTAVQKSAIEALIHEAKLLEQVARGHPNMPWYRGGCYDTTASRVIGSVFELAPFVGKQDPLLHFLQSVDVPWCVKVNVAVQLMFLVQYLSRPSSVTRLCSLLPSHFTVSERGRLLLHNIDEVLGANVDAETTDRATGELHCDAGVKFGRPADEPRGSHQSAYIAGSVLRMMARRDDELKPFLAPIASRLLQKSFVRREKLAVAVEELVVAYNSAAGPACRRQWLAELDAAAAAESEQTEDDDFQDSSEGEEADVADADADEAADADV